MTAIPYPADTRAKGWRFEIDYEKVEQSDTWSLAAEVPMAQHSLLMMWLVAWTQVPCGSFPNDEAVIRAKCKLSPKAWASMRGVLMRGWWPAEDGRLYQDTIVERVLAMLDKRANDAQRAATRRARMADSHEPPPESRVTPVVLPRDSTVSSTPSTKHQAPTASLRSAVAAACAQLPGIPEALVADYLEVRKGKKAGKFTATAVAGLEREAARAGIDLEAALRACCEFSWIGFNAQWYADRMQQAGRSSASPGETAYQRNRRERVADLAPGVARQAPGAAPSSIIIDEGAGNVVALAGR